MAARSRRHLLGTPAGGSRGSVASAGTGTRRPPGRSALGANAVGSSFALLSALWACSSPSPGGEAYAVTEGDFFDTAVRWSADGGRIAFTRRWGGTDGGTAAIFVAVPGEAAQQVTPDGSWNTGGTWSPDGSMLAYASGRPSGDTQIRVSRLATGETWPVTSGPGDKGQPDWSPGGRRIAFHSNAAGTYDVWEVDIESGASRVLVGGPSAEFSPRWSPDGTRIAFRSDRADGNFEVWTTDDSGNDLMRWTHHPAADYLPTWHPDGRSLVFMSSRGGNPDVWHLVLDGSEPVVLVASPLPESAPAVSPDGRVLLYTVVDYGQYLYETDVESGRSRRLVDHRGADAPDASPESDEVAFTVGGRVWTAAPPASARALSPDSLVAREPLWSATGEHLYFIATEPGSDGPGDLWRMEAHTLGPAERVTRTGDVSGAFRCAGSLFVLRRIAGRTALHRLHPEVDFIGDAPDGATMGWSCNSPRGPFRVPLVDGDSVRFAAFDPSDGSVAPTAFPTLSADDEFAVQGDRVVATSGSTFRNRELVVYGGLDPVRLTTSPGNDGAPAWSADGTRVFHTVVVGRINIHGIELPPGG